MPSERRYTVGTIDSGSRVAVGTEDSEALCESIPIHGPMRRGELFEMKIEVLKIYFENIDSLYTLLRIALAAGF